MCIRDSDENDASVAVSMCNKLIYNDNVCAIIGSTNSSVTLGAMLSLIHILHQSPRRGPSAPAG